MTPSTLLPSWLPDFHDMCAGRYSREGMEEGVFSESREHVASLEKDYEELNLDADEAADANDEEEDED